MLYVSHTATVSGAERALLDLLGGLPAGVDALVACPSGDLRQRVGRLGVDVRLIRESTVSLRPSASTPIGLVALAQAGATVRRLARRWGASVVHANTVRSGLAVAASPCAGAHRSPLVVHVRDLVPGGTVGRAVRGVVAHGARGTIANSAATARAWGTTTAVVPSPVDLSRFDPEAVTPAVDLPAGTLLGLVGQVTPWKGQLEAVEALAAVRRTHPDAQLILVGAAKFVARATRFDNYAYEAEVRATADRLGVTDAVHWLGEREDVPSVLAGIDVALLPSWAEPFGRSGIEAMAMGLPLVATRAGGPLEYVDDGRTGLLVQPRDPGALAEAVSVLLDDPRRRSAMARAGQDEIRARYGLDRHVADVLAVYERVCAQ